MLKRIASVGALALALLVAAGLVAAPAQAAPSVIVLGDPAGPQPAGVTVEPAKTTAPGGVTPALGGCLNDEVCVWTDSLGPSQPAGYLYRWGIGYRGTTIFIGPGTWYHTVSFMQNRQAASRARAQTSCPGIFTDPTGPWLYDEQYASFAGKLINDGAACIISQYV